MLTDDMKRVVSEQRLAFIATVCADGSPNLSPKGATYVLDDAHLFFADVRSAVRQMRAGGSALVGRVKAIVVISVQEARPLSSPVYDAENVTEADVIKLNLARFDALYSKRR